MTWIIATAVALTLSSSALADAPLSRGDQMKACAAQWKAQGHHSHGMRYQHFISACLKKMSTRPQLRG